MSRPNEQLMLQLQKAMDEEGISRCQLARHLKMSYKSLRNFMKGERDMRIRLLSDMFFYCNRQLSISFVQAEEGVDIQLQLPTNDKV